MPRPSQTDMFIWVDKRFRNPIQTYCDFPVTTESQVAVKDLANQKIVYEPGMQIIPKYQPLIELLNEAGNFAYLMFSNMPDCDARWQCLQIMDQIAKALVDTFKAQEGIE